MNTCDTCKYWGVHYQQTCDRIEITDDENVTSFNALTGTEAEIDYDVCDDSGLSVSLRTGPKFGCVKHESE